MVELKIQSSEFPERRCPVSGRKLDNLDRDVIAAQRLGYGVHYGRYKADHPFTAREEKPPVAPEMPEEDRCRYCGQVLQKTHGSQRYCSDACRTEAIRQRARDYYIKRKNPPGQLCCAECGKLFIPSNSRQMYCRKACRGRAKRRRDELRNKEAEKNAKALAK